MKDSTENPVREYASMHHSRSHITREYIEARLAETRARNGISPKPRPKARAAVAVATPGTNGWSQFYNTIR